MDRPFTATNPNAIPIAGITPRPNGPAVTIAWNAVHLQDSGDLVVGESTIQAHPIPIPPASEAAVYTIQGQLLTADPSAIAVASHILTPGGSALSIDGIPGPSKIAGTGKQLGKDTRGISSYQTIDTLSKCGKMILESTK